MVYLDSLLTNGTKATELVNYYYWKENILHDY